MASVNTKRVVVEARKDPRPAAMLNALAHECQRLGYQVTRWRGPLSGRIPESRWLPPCDLAIIFNGKHTTYQATRQVLQQRNTATLFVELGWYPQSGHYQLDSQGVNADASWANEPLPHSKPEPLTLRDAGDLLVLGQLNDDTQITAHSPWYRDLESFIRFLGTHAALPLRVRAHPLDPHRETLQQLARQLGATWDISPNLTTALQTAKAVACINSSAAIEAMALGLPVLCFGDAIYRHQDLVYPLSNDADAVRAVTQELAAGRCELSASAMRAMVQRVQDHQWTPAQVPQRLAPLLELMLANRSAVNVDWSARSAWEASMTWCRDLPSRLLYARRRSA
jgi:Capsule polysaccharide biosynthesis protein